MQGNKDTKLKAVLEAHVRKSAAPAPSEVPAEVLKRPAGAWKGACRKHESAGADVVKLQGGQWVLAVVNGHAQAQGLVTNAAARPRCATVHRQLAVSFYARPSMGFDSINPAMFQRLGALLEPIELIVNATR
ncbi:unnamed protein product, partial [Prorocentrum cordatum]